MKKIIISTVVSTIILFLWGGISQMLPWGISTTQNINAQTVELPEQIKVSDLIRLQPSELTTEKFESQFNGKISTYATDHTFSWIITQPYQKDYSVYFMKEVITQLIVAILLSGILFLTLQLKLKTRMLLILVFGLSASTAIYGQLMNWWGIPAGYAFGVSLNLIIGWILVSYISARYIIRPQSK
ncbi:MAG: hypothetical protein JNM78_03145 [Cyclobacteriaceae bacterium]|nr:hypothetical protein [Cyclobacteriaceae bacterium]